MRIRFVFLAVGLAIASNTASAAQHEDHQGQASGTASAQVMQCSQAQSVVNTLVEAALKRAEAARLTNNPAAMRDAVDDLQSVLIDIRAQLSPCSGLAAAAAAGHAGHTMPDVRQAPAAPSGTPPTQPGSPVPAPGAVAPSAPAGIDPHAGHTSAHTTESPSATTAGSGVTARGGLLPAPPTAIGTLKCRTTVDPKTAPRMLHGGRMYYFCTEEERAAFAKDPSRYALPTEEGAPTHAH